MVSHGPHKPENVGSIPTSATNGKTMAKPLKTSGKPSLVILAERGPSVNLGIPPKGPVRGGFRLINLTRRCLSTDKELR